MRRPQSTAALGAAVGFVYALVSCDGPIGPDPINPAALKPKAAEAAAGQGGSWSAPFAWPLVAAHMSVLPNGNVLSWVSSDAPGDTERHHVYVWNVATGAFVEHSEGTHNAFCTAHTFLGDGRLLVAGGHISDNKGLKQAAIWNWQTGAWEPTGSLHAGRWYPTATTLVSGEVSIVAGSDDKGAGNVYPEVWQNGVWRELRGAPLNPPYYPWMHSAPDGRLFNSGPEEISRFLNPSAGGEWTLGPRSHVPFREYGGSVMYAPGKILIMGGGDPPTNSSETIDLNVASLTWQVAGAMRYARRQMNSTVLPNGRVLALGGSTGSGFNDESQPALSAETWDPGTRAWTTLASMQTPRMYHSSAVLLPDGRVLYAGGGRCSGCTANHFNAELFSPPYLLNTDGTVATRPQITAAPTSVNYGQAFTVETPNAASIARVTWVRLPATTHSFNQNQGFNELPFTKTASGLTATAPAAAYLAPPGHYMLFVLNAAGVPSVAKVVRVVGSAALPPRPALPSAPTNLAASAVDNSTIRVQWTDNSTSEFSFRVERCLGAACTDFR